MAITATNELERCLQAAVSAGCVEDQVRQFLSFGYVAQPWQYYFHAAARSCDLRTGPEEIGLGGARGPGKSHGVLSQVALDDMQRVPELKFLFLRKVQKNAKESFEDLIGKVLRHCPHNYIPSERKIVLENGSRCLFGGFKDEKDIDGYIGIEYDGIVIEESNQLTEKKHEMLRGSLRTSKDNWRPRIYHSFNPGGVGHQYIRKKFVLPYRQHRELLTRFIPSTYRDNAFLNPEYKTWLEGLAGPLGKAWRDGDFDVFEGQAFPAWDYEIHVVPMFEIPEHWMRWRAIDWGFAAPMCCLWFAKDPDTKRIIVYRELYRTQLTVPQQAGYILDYTPPLEKIMFTYADPAMWSRKTVGNRVISTADEYKDAGILLTQADNDRLTGKRKVDALLSNQLDGKPGLLIFENCENLIRTLPALTFDTNRIEDVDTEQEDHAYDTLKYGLTNYKLPQPTQQTNNYTSPIVQRGIF